MFVSLYVIYFSTFHDARLSSKDNEASLLKLCFCKPHSAHFSQEVEDTIRRTYVCDTVVFCTALCFNTKLVWNALDKRFPWSNSSWIVFF